MDVTLCTSRSMAAPVITCVVQPQKEADIVMKTGVSVTEAALARGWYAHN
jgi:hypothetical protein